MSQKLLNQHEKVLLLSINYIIHYTIHIVKVINCTLKQNVLLLHKQFPTLLPTANNKKIIIYINIFPIGLFFYD